MTPDDVPLTLYQFALLVEIVVVTAACWFKGGHPERTAAAWVLAVAVLKDAVLPEWMVGSIFPLELVLDLALTALFLRLAMTGQRWWPFAAAGAIILMVTLNLHHVLTGSLFESRTYVSAQVGLTALMLLTLLLGVFERVLAGERPAMEASGSWRRVRSRGAP